MIIPIITGLINLFFINFLMGSDLFFDLENDDVFVNYREHLTKTTEFDTIRKFQHSKITELTNAQDNTRTNRERLKKLLAFL